MSVCHLLFWLLSFFCAFQPFTVSFTCLYSIKFHLSLITVAFLLSKQYGPQNARHLKSKAQILLHKGCIQLLIYLYNFKWFDFPSWFLYM